MMTFDEVLRRCKQGNPTPPRRVELTEDQWREKLDETVFSVTRHSATERPFSSDLCSLFSEGEYQCACCGTLLFDASEKFDSGTGWPSFTNPVDPTVVAYSADHTHGRTRVEAACAVCDAHLGHVFSDGPPPSGLRYCMNAVALVKASN